MAGSSATPDGTLIVSVSGIRGIVGHGLSAEKALAFASALGGHLHGGTVVLSRDGRPSGAMLRHAVLAGLLQTGCAVHDLGIVSTPTCGLAIRRLNAHGGVQITASHNPAEWNGLKLFSARGAVLSVSGFGGMGISVAGGGTTCALAAALKKKAPTTAPRQVRASNLGAARLSLVFLSRIR